jgi:cytosine deaminase
LVRRARCECETKRFPHLAMERVMQALVTQRGNDDEVRALWGMTTTQAAKLMRLKDYGVAVGGPADLVMLDAPDPVTALRTVAPVLAAFTRGRRTVSREPVRLHRPRSDQ